MNATLPKFRSDLTISEQQTANGRSFVVKDPVSGQYFYFGETERFIAQQFDGKTPLQEARQRTEQTFGSSLPEETLNVFIKNLEKAGLLEMGGRQRSGSRRIRGNFLYLRMKLFDPDRLLNHLVGKVRFCFTPYFLSCSAAVILLAAGTWVANWSEFMRDLSNLYRFSSIPFLMAVIFFVVSMHEFAHGLTCKHFGGEVHEMGFLLIYFQPALYCNVSDAWLFPEKSKRLLVGAAGPYFELFLWACATLTWRVTDAETWVNSLALIVMAGSGIKTLFNFNPLIKLDGYYLLSDYLEIPNLRKKSFRYIGDSLKKLAGWNDQPMKAINRRERRIYLIYGLIATITSFSLLGFITLQLGDFFITNNQPIALLFFLLLLSTRFRRRLRRLFGKGPNEEDFEEGAALEESPGNHNGGDQSKASAKKEKSRRHWKRRLNVLIIVGVILAILFLGRMELRVSGPINILPEHNADVRAELEGIIEHIYVTEGEAISQGTLLARISDRELRTELEKAKAGVRETEARLRMLERGPTAEEIELARTAVEKTKDRLTFARGRTERDKMLFEKGLLSKKEYEDVLELATVAENDLAEAESKLKVLLKGSRSEEIEATRAQLASLEAQQRYLEGQLQRVEVRSPVAGVVTTPARQLKEITGQAIEKGALIVKVYNYTKLTVEIAIPEKEIADVKIGQEVAVKANAYPNETFYGVVTSIGTTARSGSQTTSTSSPLASIPSSETGSKTILVTTEIDNSPLMLKPEMTGQAKIYCGEWRLFDLAMRRLARMVKVEFWSWW